MKYPGKWCFVIGWEVPIIHRIMVHLKRWEALCQQHTFTSQKTWILSPQFSVPSVKPCLVELFQWVWFIARRKSWQLHVGRQIQHNPKRTYCATYRCMFCIWLYVLFCGWMFCYMFCYMVVCFVCFYVILYIMYSYCYVYVFLLLCVFHCRYYVLLCCSLYCLCVYVYWTTATGWLPNCS
jgi:hypothetical protein